MTQRSLCARRNNLFFCYMTGISNTGLERLWAPRVPQRDIRRLYELDARGIRDEELLDEVGWALWSRCESFIMATEATKGRAKCPGCGATIRHNWLPEEVLLCSRCGWETTWQTYFKSIQHKQLSGATFVVALFKDFIRRFPQARSAGEKMLLIDNLIHSFHWNTKYGPTRTTGVNLIEGKYHEVVDFLDSLTYGDDSTPGTHKIHLEWRGKINDTATSWGDERLKRPQE